MHFDFWHNVKSRIVNRLIISSIPKPQQIKDSIENYMYKYNSSYSTPLENPS